VVTDPKKVLLALRWACLEMDKRYEVFAKVGVRNIAGFNARPLPKTQAELDAEKDARVPVAAAITAVPEDLAIPNAAADTSQSDVATEPTVDFDSMNDDELFSAPAPKARIEVPRDADELIIPDRMPYLVIIVDELADLMQTAPADVESAIARLTQKARAAGIPHDHRHADAARDVITGVIKANVPCRSPSRSAARSIHASSSMKRRGAPARPGRHALPPAGTAKMLRGQGVLVTDEEVTAWSTHAAQQQDPQFEASIHERSLSDTGWMKKTEVSDEDEELVQKCLEVMRQEKKASTSLFQRRLRLGLHSRCADS
jgi:S-DNA-T family DNA segregation ATPase FtsK/SpoIIIE